MLHNFFASITKDCTWKTLEKNTTVFEIRTSHLAGYFSGKAEKPLN